MPLRLVLVYTDFPGSQLVNNLNLLATSPSGKVHSGNGESNGQLQLDVTNNIEVIKVANPQKGDWTIQVVASNVPQGPQDYALVILGGAELEG